MVPALDVLKHEMREEEFGTPADPGDLPVLLEWSPYQNIAPATYPPVLVQIGRSTP